MFRAKFHVFRGEHGTIEGRLIMQANLSAGQERDLSSRIMGRVRLLGCARHNLEAKCLHATTRGICSSSPVSIRIERFSTFFSLRCINCRCIILYTNSNRYENVDASFVRISTKREAIKIIYTIFSFLYNFRFRRDVFFSFCLSPDSCAPMISRLNERK